MMAGEIQEPFNLSLLENSIHSGSVSFGRFEKEALSWEKRSSFSHNRYLEEAVRFSKPGSVTQMRAHFEAHFKKKGIMFPTSVEAQTCGEVVDHHHHQIGTEKKDENLWESTSQHSNYSFEQEERSQFGDSCVSYDEILVISDDHRSSLSVALEKTEIGRSTEMTREDKEETTSSPATRPKTLKMVKKASSYTKKHVVITKGAPSCNTKTSFDTKKEKEWKQKRIVKSIVSKSPTSKRTESTTPLATNKLKSKNCIDSATKEKKTTFSFRSNEGAEKRKEEKVETVVRKALNFKARPMPKSSTEARPQHTSKGQEKARDDAQERSSKASCDRSFANGTAKSKLISVNKQRADLERSPKRILPKSSDQTARNNANRRSLAVRRSAFEVAL